MIIKHFISDAILDEAPKQMKKGDDQNKKDQKTEQEAIDETVAKCKLKVVQSQNLILLSSHC